jgi:hypothetical protein
MGMSHLVRTTSVDQPGDAVAAFHTIARDRKLGAYQGASETVEQRVICALVDGGRIVQRGVSEPSGKPTCGPIWIGGGARRFVGHIGIHLGDDRHLNFTSAALIDSLVGCSYDQCPREALHCTCNFSSRGKYC